MCVRLLIQTMYRTHKATLTRIRIMNARICAQRNTNFLFPFKTRKKLTSSLIRNAWYMQWICFYVLWWLVMMTYCWLCARHTAQHYLLSPSSLQKRNEETIPNNREAINTEELTKWSENKHKLSYTDIIVVMQCMCTIIEYREFKIQRHNYIDAVTIKAVECWCRCNAKAEKQQLLNVQHMIQN